MNLSKLGLQIYNFYDFKKMFYIISKLFKCTEKSKELQSGPLYKLWTSVDKRGLIKTQGRRVLGPTQQKGGLVTALVSMSAHTSSKSQ